MSRIDAAPSQSTPLLLVNALELALDDAFQTFGLTMEVTESAEACIQGLFGLDRVDFFRSCARTASVRKSFFRVRFPHEYGYEPVIRDRAVWTEYRFLR